MTFSLRWRVIAALGLVNFAAIIVLAVFLAVSNILLGILSAVTIGLCLYACWLIMSGTGRRLWAGRILLGIAALLLIAEIIILLTENKNFGVVIALTIALILYVLLIAVLRTKYWQLQRDAHAILGEKFLRPILIINPKSGDGRALKNGVDKKAKAMGVEVIVLKSGDDMTAIARDAVRDGADVLGISGGDGSIGAVAVVALEHDVPLAVLPGGTRCHFARDLGMDPEHILDALASFQGVERRIDVGSINGRIFLNNASLGLYADIIDFPGYRENKLRASRTVLTELLEGKRKLYELTFTSPDGTKYQQAAQILLGVNRYQMANIIELGYRERMDEGVLQVTVVTEITDRMVRQSLRSASFGHMSKMVGGRYADQWVAQDFTVSSQAKELVIGVDGEREKYKTPVHMAIKPGRLRVVVPTEGVRPRRRRATDWVIVHELWLATIGKAWYAS